jgi:hypothetical protein
LLRRGVPRLKRKSNSQCIIISDLCK